MAAAGIMRNHAQKVKIPTSSDRIHKEECVFCFDTPESQSGLYVCMSTFQGLCHRHVEQHFARTDSSVYLHEKRIKTEIKSDPATEVKPTKLAIGVEGGFEVGGKKYEYEQHFTIVIMPDYYEIPLPCPDLPEMVQLSVTTILASDAASKVDEVQALAGTWDGMKREVTKHADTLVQLENGKKIPPKGSKCEVCGLTENLWLNLTDGAVHCGRKYFDGYGGNNHAVEHYNETKYPLVVKLGTITSEAADIYSYDEDNMVLDPNLPAHLAHFGINISQLEKTEKCLIELEIELNQRIGEWAVIQESGTPLVPIHGPSYTGLVNLGNSCYMNSVVQVLFSIPDFQQKYFALASDIISKSPNDPTLDFNVQMAKLAHGLLSGDYSQPSNEASKEAAAQEQAGIKPHMFKCLIGQGHPEFSTKRQQDAEEFFRHLITVIERHSHNDSNPADALKFQVEEKIQCSESKKVKYDTRTEYILSLPIPLSAAVNKEKVLEYERRKAEKVAKGDRIENDEIVRPQISLEACLQTFASEELISDFFSSAINAKTNAFKTIRIHTFPDYLMLHLKKFTVDDDWVPRKLDVSIDVPDQLELSWLRGKGKQPNEEELPEIQAAKTNVATQFFTFSPKEFQFDEGALVQLTEMGFPLEACKRALFNTQNGGSDLALNWLMQHISDADFSLPFNPNAQGAVKHFFPDETAMATIVSMGFTDRQAAKALEATDNHLERAMDWIFSHPEEVEMQVENMDCTDASLLQTAKYRDGPERYNLVAFISHMGPSTVAGHYVCHIKKDGRWVIYNDSKVALSEHPPKDLAYMYLYERCSS